MTNSSIRFVFCLSFFLLRTLFMSLLVNHPSKLCYRKPVLVRSSPHLSNVFTFLLPQTHSNVWIVADPCAKRGRVIISRRGDSYVFPFTKELEEREEKDSKLITELDKEIGTIGSSNGWLPTLKDGVLCLQEFNLNHDTGPKRILLPPLVTLPHCQTQYVTNVAMSSSSSPEDEDCVVAVKFLGPQLSFCRTGKSNSEWINIRIANLCFFSSPVMFCIAGSGGHLMGSWDLHKPSKNPKLQILRFQNLPQLTKTKQDLLDSCYTSEHLVESITTNETFMVKLYKKTEKIINDVPRMKTEAIMVFKLDEEGNAVYTQDIGDQSIFLTMSEGFCVPRSSYHCMRLRNRVRIFDVNDLDWFEMNCEATILKTYCI